MSLTYKEKCSFFFFFQETVSLKRLEYFFFLPEIKYASLDFCSLVNMVFWDEYFVLPLPILEPRVRMG